jgi:hypothetical protein
MRDPTNDTHATGSQFSRPYLQLRVANSSRSELGSSRVQLERSFNQHRHITWNEAWSAESKREQARLTACLEIPTAGPIRLLVDNIAREFRKAKPERFAASAGLRLDALQAQPRATTSEKSFSRKRVKIAKFRKVKTR